MTTFSNFLRSTWSHSVKDPWPAGNDFFAQSIESVAIHGGHKTILRPRGQGTTTLLMALAHFAVQELKLDYLMWISADRGFAESHAESFAAVTLGGLSRRDGMTVDVGGRLVQFAGIRQSLRGATRCIAGRFIRPQLTIMDLGTEPQSPAAKANLERNVHLALGLQGPGQSPRTLTVWTKE